MLKTKSQHTPTKNRQVAGFNLFISPSEGRFPIPLFSLTSLEALSMMGEALLGQANPFIGIWNACQAKRRSQVFSDFWDRLRRDYISASGLDWLQDAIKRRFN
jgi:hypothetical protein